MAAAAEGVTEILAAIPELQSERNCSLLLHSLSNMLSRDATRNPVELLDSVAALSGQQRRRAVQTMQDAAAKYKLPASVDGFCSFYGASVPDATAALAWANAMQACKHDVLPLALVQRCVLLAVLVRPIALGIDMAWLHACALCCAHRVHTLA